MDRVIICEKCFHRSPVPPHARAIRCHGCGKYISVGNDQEARLIETSRKLVQDQGDISTERRRLRDVIFKKRCSGSTTPSNVSPPSVTVSPRFSLQVSEPPPPPRGKRAFLCGVTYKKQKIKLRGTAQDVKSMRHLLIDKYHFPTASIFILTEEEPYKPPTRRNIQEGFKWLTADLQPGDSLVFYFSGHGLRQPDFDQDEIDGFDETICPVDFMTAGMIIDNDINDAIVRPLKHGVTLHAIIDSCHSGTILDLPHVYNRTSDKWDSNHPPSGKYKGTSGGLAICFSGCEDNQLAADTSAFSPGKTMTGAMTSTFMKAVQDKPKITYRGILDFMHDTILEATKSRCGGIRRMFHRRIFQEPQLSSSSEKFNIDSEFKL